MDIELYYDKIYRYIFFKVNNRTLAEDLTQETFLRFLGAECEQPERFLYTIARNLCIDEYRRIKPLSTEDEEALAVSCEFENTLVNSLTVRKALESLNPDDRDMLILRYVNSEPIQDIARFYDMSRFAVYRRIKEAGNRLKKLLEGGN